LLTRAFLDVQEDRETLAGLFSYVHDSNPQSEDHLQATDNSATPSSRRSRGQSISSIDTYNTFVTPTEEIPDPFQTRRKRAEKLSHFFGESHKTLFGDVLESIESGVQDDRAKGRLTYEEVQVSLLNSNACSVLYVLCLGWSVYYNTDCGFEYRRNS